MWDTRLDGFCPGCGCWQPVADELVKRLSSLTSYSDVQTSLACPAVFKTGTKAWTIGVCALRACWNVEREGSQCARGAHPKRERRRAIFKTAMHRKSPPSNATLGNTFHQRVENEWKVFLDGDDRIVGLNTSYENDPL